MDYSAGASHAGGKPDEGRVMEEVSSVALLAGSSAHQVQQQCNGERMLRESSAKRFNC